MALISQDIASCSPESSRDKECPENALWNLCKIKSYISVVEEKKKKIKQTNKKRIYSHNWVLLNLTWYLQMHMECCMLGVNFLQAGILCSVFHNFGYAFEHDYNWFIRWATYAAAEREFVRKSSYLFVFGCMVAGCYDKLFLLICDHMVLTAGNCS